MMTNAHRERLDEVETNLLHLNEALLLGKIAKEDYDFRMHNALASLHTCVCTW